MSYRSSSVHPRARMEQFQILQYSFRPYNRLDISSWVLSLHYRATFFVLVIASLTVIVKQFGGRPIECAVGTELAGDVVNNYCWVHATFSRWGQPPDLTHSWRTISADAESSSGIMPFEPGGKSREVIQSYPGVRTYIPGDEIRTHRYYQWVSGLLLLQSLPLLALFSCEPKEYKTIFLLGVLGKKFVVIDYFNCVGHNEQ